MNQLIGLYFDDGRIVSGRAMSPYPVSVNTGYSLVGPVLAGYIPNAPTSIIVGYRTVRNIRMPIYGLSTVPTSTILQSPLTQYQAAFANLTFNPWAPWGYY